jgi:hypothetical protein
MELTRFIDAYLLRYNKFYMSDLRNAHVEIAPVKLYTRKSRRVIRPNETHSFLDIASITIERDQQQKGIFTALLKALLLKYPKENFFIESIVNDNVRKVAEREGFLIRPQNLDLEEGYDMYLIR